MCVLRVETTSVLSENPIPSSVIPTLGSLVVRDGVQFSLHTSSLLRFRDTLLLYSGLRFRIRDGRGTVSEPPNPTETPGTGVPWT